MDKLVNRTRLSLIFVGALQAAIAVTCYALPAKASSARTETSGTWVNLDTEGLGFSDLAMTSKICKATISMMMGRSTAIMSDTDASVEDSVFTVKISYVRDDGTPWSYRCKVSGDTIVWKAENGRWRTHPDDEKYHYTLNGNVATIVETSGFSGEVRDQDFSLSEICVRSFWPTCPAQGYRQ